MNEPNKHGDLQVIAGVMKKLLPPALLAEVLGYLDPLGTFEQALQAAAPPGDVPPRQETAARTIHGGNCGTTPFYLQPGQCSPEYDQGHSVVVWYDDLYDLAERAKKVAGDVPPPPLEAK